MKNENNIDKVNYFLYVFVMIMTKIQDNLF